MNNVDIFDTYVTAIAWGVYESPDVIKRDCTGGRNTEAYVRREWIVQCLTHVLNECDYIFALPPEGVTRRLDNSADQCMTYSPAEAVDYRADFSSDERNNVYADLEDYWWYYLPLGVWWVTNPTDFKPCGTFEYTPGV